MRALIAVLFYNSWQLTIVALIFLFAALLMLYTPIKGLGNNYTAVQMAFMAMDRVFDAPEVEPKIKNVENPIVLTDVRDKIAVVFQDNFLFSGTILDNITLGKTDYTQERPDQAIKSACLDEFIGSLERGLMTDIGEYAGLYEAQFKAKRHEK